MKRPLFCCLMMLLTALVTGCGGPSSPPPITIPPHVYSMDGNWNFSLLSTTSPSNSIGLGGVLTTTNGNVSGILFHTALPLPTPDNDTCFDVLDPVSFSGTIDSTGLLHLVSAVTQNQVLTATGALGSDNAEITLGSYAITASDATKPACGKGETGTFQASAMQPLSGTYAGTITPRGGAPLAASLVVVQTASADGFGRLHLQGTLQVTGMPCFAQASIDTSGDGTANPSTFLQGAFFLVSFDASGASGATMIISGFFDPKAKTIQFPLYVIANSTCNVGEGTASFTRS